MTEETKTEDKKGIKAKDASLAGKIVGGVEILAGGVALITLVCCHKLTAEEARSLFAIVLECGFGVMAIFGTVDLNLIIDKFVKKEQ